MPEAYWRLAGRWSEPCERNHRIVQQDNRALAGRRNGQSISVAPPGLDLIWVPDSGGSASLHPPANLQCPSRTCTLSVQRSPFQILHVLRGKSFQQVLQIASSV